MNVLFLENGLDSTWEQVVIVAVAVRAGAGVGASGPLPRLARWQ